MNFQGGGKYRMQHGPTYLTQKPFLMEYFLEVLSYLNQGSKFLQSGSEMSLSLRTQYHLPLEGGNYKRVTNTRLSLSLARKRKENKDTNQPSSNTEQDNVELCDL